MNKKIIHPLQLELYDKIKSQTQLKSRSEKIPALVCNKLSVAYPDGTQALHDIRLHIPERSIVTIAGSNGSGKTTFAKACVKLLKPSLGTIMIYGRDIRNMDKTSLLKSVGYVPTDPNDILFNDTVREELKYALDNLEIPYTAEFISSLVNTFDLNDLLEKHPETLSLGQQKRLIIAAALAIQPKILFIDEPTLALDSGSVESLVNLFNNLRKSMTIVLLTHDLDILIPLSDHLIVLDKGKVIFEGEPRESFDSAIAESANLRIPALWNIWKNFPKITTWEELAEKVVSIYESRLDN